MKKPLSSLALGRLRLLFLGVRFEKFPGLQLREEPSLVLFGMPSQDVEQKTRQNQFCKQVDASYYSSPT